MATPDLLEGLNKEQREAVSAPPGPTLVVAGPGSGKTSVLTKRVAYLIQEMGVKPGQIMAVTFTNKAAREMQDRITRLLGDGARGVTIGTFHSICARILRREAPQIGYKSDYTIYDTDDQLAVVKQAMSELNLDSKRNSPYGQLHKISAAKNELISPEEYVASTPPEKITQQIYARYQQLLQLSGAFDFDDLLMMTVILFRQFPETLRRYQGYYQHILVDEFQDTNTAQYQLVRRLAGQHNNLFVVGDPDQSIYRFRGAVPRNVQDFRKDYDHVNLIRLGQNYRSHQLILDAATAVIRHNADHIPITLTGQRPTGTRIIFHNVMTEDQEAQYIVEQIAEHVRQGFHPRDCAVMYRVNAQSRSLEEAFVRAGLPYRLVGGTRFYSRKEIKDVLAYLRLIHNPDDMVSLRRVINVPPRGLGDKTIQQLEAWAAGRKQTIFQALESLAQGEPGPFNARAEKALIDFVQLIDTWQQSKMVLPIAALLDDVLARTRYTDHLDNGAEDAQERIENIAEFRGLALEYSNTPLSAFLEEVSLVADADNRDDIADAPTLLTLHAAKGLEFAVVFIAGLEEGTLPHQRSLDDEEQMAEERRLMYVGITRAKEVLHLIWVMRRSMYGGSGDYLLPSRFLGDIPTHLTEGSPLPARASSQRDWRAYQQVTTWSPPSTTQPVTRRAERQPTYRSGQRVIHAKFGEGIVIASAIRSGTEELDIRFADKNYGFKKISADFVKLLE